MASVAPRPALAQTRELQRVDLTTLTLEFGAAFVLFSGAYLAPRPEKCRWCNPPGFDEALAAPAAPSGRRAAAAMSHVASTALVPLMSLAVAAVPPFVTSEPDVHAFENVVIVSEAIVLTQAVTIAAKKLAARRRPAFYYGRQGSTEYAEVPSQENLSFFSGDTSAPFAAAASAATLAFMRGYSSAPYVAIAGGALSSAAAILRVRADVHWPSDVLTGAVVGTAIGIAVPLFLHPRAPVAAAPSQSNLLMPEVASDGVKLTFVGSF